MSRTSPLLIALLLVGVVVPAASGSTGYEVELEAQTDRSYSIVSAEVRDVGIAGEVLLIVHVNSVRGESRPAVELHHLDILGNLKSYGSFTSTGPLPAWFEDVLTFRVRLGAIERGDRLIVGQRPVTRDGPPNCEQFCDRCAARADACPGGVASYSCACSAEERHCNYVCLE